ncbi:MAG: hypothetical protein AAF998_13640 [Bacteroidota bacterium]
MRKPAGIAVLTVMLALLCSIVNAQPLTLNYFNATPDGSDVLVAFQLPTEDGVTNIKVWRKIDNESQYTFLDHIQPTGALEYRYLDYTIFKDDPRTINYRLQVYRSGAVFTYHTTIIHNPTSVQRTWGSIKAMFR